MQIKKIILSLVLLLIFSCRSIELPKNSSPEIKTLSNIILNFSSRIDRDVFYAFFSSLSLELPEYISKDFDYRVLEEDGTRIEIYRKKDVKSRKLIIIANGGAFVTPYRADRREIFNKLFKDLDFDFMIVDYKTGVNRRFPIQSIDYMNGYRLSLKLGYSPNKIVFLGDSSGGNIVSSCLVYLVDNNLPLPASVIMLSPYLDASNTVDSRVRNLHKDVVFGVPENTGKIPKFQNKLPYFVALKEEDLKNRYVSPIFSDNLYNFPKTLIHVGGYEILEDDSIEMANLLKKYNVDVTLKVFPGLIHVFQILNTPESHIAIKEILDFANNSTSISTEDIKVENEIINKIRFEIKFSELTEDEIIEKYKKDGIDIKKYFDFEKESYENTLRKTLIK